MLRCVTVFAICLVIPGATHAQITPASNDVPFWLTATTLAVGAVILDRPIRRRMMEDTVASDRSPALRQLSRVGNTLGTASTLVPSMAATYVVARIARNNRLGNDVVEVAAGYVASDFIGSVLKPVVGRARPHVTGDPGSFRPFTNSGDWHSFPSGHMLHVASIAGGIAEEAHRPWVSALGYAAVSIVGWQRIYADQHWASDVVAGGLIGVVTSKTTVHWLRRRGDRGAHVGVLPGPEGCTVWVRLGGD